MAQKTLVYCAAYIVLIVASSLLAGFNPPDNRLLAPAFPFLLISAALLVSRRR